MEANKASARWAEEIRDDRGMLPSFTWPGGYQLIYVSSDGASVCPDCANLAAFRVIDTREDNPRDGFRLDGVYIHWEGPAEVCSYCGEEVEAAYGDPDAPLTPEEGR